MSGPKTAAGGKARAAVTLSGSVGSPRLEHKSKQSESVTIVVLYVTAALRKLHSLDPRPCPICQRMYSNLSNLRQHMRLIHIPQSVECPLCSRSFKTKLYLRRHLLSFHDIPVKWENSVAGAPNQSPAGANIISGLMSQASAAPNQNASTWSTTSTSTLITPANPAASVSLTAAPRPSTTGAPMPHSYLNVEEELKRTYLQSPHRVRSSCSITVATESRQDDSSLGQHCLPTSGQSATSATGPAVHSSPGKDDAAAFAAFHAGVPLVQPKSEPGPDFMRPRFAGDGQQSQMGQFAGRGGYANVHVPYSENT